MEKGSKQKNIILQIQNLIYLYLILFPILDVFLYFTSVNKGSLVYKSIITFQFGFVIVVSLFYVYKGKFKDKVYAVFLAIVYIVITNILRNISIAKDIKLDELILNLNRAYLVILSTYIFIKSFYKKSLVKLSMSLNYAAFLYILTLLISIITKTSNFQYTDPLKIKRSYYGWFNSKESIYLLINLYLINAYMFLRNKKNKNFTAFLILIITIFLGILSSNKDLRIYVLILTLTYIAVSYVCNVLLNNLLKKEIEKEKTKYIDKYLTDEKQNINKKVFKRSKKIKQILSYLKFLKPEYIFSILGLFTSLIGILTKKIDLNMVYIFVSIYLIYILNYYQKIKEIKKNYDKYKLEESRQYFRDVLESKKKSETSIQRRIELESTINLHDILDRTQSIYLNANLKDKNKKNLLVNVYDEKDLNDGTLINILNNLGINIQINLIINKNEKEKLSKNRIYTYNGNNKFNTYILNKDIFVKDNINMSSIKNIYFNLINRISNNLFIKLHQLNLTQRKITYINIKNINKLNEEKTKRKKEILWITNKEKYNWTFKDKRELKKIIDENIICKYYTDIIIEDIKVYEELSEYLNEIIYYKKNELSKFKKDNDDNILNKISFIKIHNINKVEVYEENIEGVKQIRKILFLD